MTGKLPVIAPDVTFTVVLPILPPVTRPSVPATLLTVATVLSVELQITLDVILTVALLSKTPVAINCRVSPTATVGLAGVRLI